MNLANKLKIGGTMATMTKKPSTKRLGSLPRAEARALQLHERTCVFCATTGSLRRDADYYYHDRARLNVAVGYVHAVHGSVWCDFCQREQPGTEVHRETLCEKPIIYGRGQR